MESLQNFPESFLDLIYVGFVGQMWNNGTQMSFMPFTDMGCCFFLKKTKKKLAS